MVDVDVCDTTGYTGWLDAGVSIYIYIYASGDYGRKQVGVMDENNEAYSSLYRKQLCYIYREIYTSIADLQSYRAPEAL